MKAKTKTKTKTKVKTETKTKIIKMEQFATGKRILMLRTCNSDMTSHNGFKWPESGYVEASDWDPTDRCGGGLHGFPWGEGDGDLASWDSDAKWLVWEALASEVVHITQDGGGKSKAPRGVVVFCGDREGATRYILEHGGFGRAVIGANVSVGDRKTAVVGDRGAATAGNRGTATAGYGGTATAGYKGTAIAGEDGTATAGKDGIIQIKWWDGKRYRLAVGYVGENGIVANKLYRCNEFGKLVNG